MVIITHKLAVILLSEKKLLGILVEKVHVFLFRFCDFFHISKGKLTIFYSSFTFYFFGTNSIKKTEKTFRIAVVRVVFLS